jgi:NADPH:quinone reductase-like Zn-dependent oxidoreductase
VAAVASGRDADLVRGLGADEVLDYTREDVTAGEARYDVVFDAVNVPAFREARRVLRPNGGFVTVDPFIGRLSPGWLARFRDGRRIESVLVRPDGGDLERVGAWIGAGEVTPVIRRSYPVADAAAAHRLSESRRARGKIVLIVDERLADERPGSLPLRGSVPKARP